MDIISLFLKGTKALESDRAQAESTKLGVLRGGSCGAFVNGEVYGTCHRITLARFSGLQEPIGPTKRAIFDSGEANEFVWLRALRAAGDYEVWHDADIPEEYRIKWYSEGVLGTGTPDIILAKDGIPFHGIELKIVESLQSAAGLYLDNKPKGDNLIQAAHYSMRMNLPYTLVYTFNGTGEFPYWAIKKYNIPRGKKVDPFKLAFTLNWGKTLTWTGADGVVHDTLITKESIEDYYKLVLEMQKDKDLYLRYPSKEIDGTNMAFDKCNYCSINEACSEYEVSGDYDLWIDRVRQIWKNK